MNRNQQSRAAQTLDFSSSLAATICLGFATLVLHAKAAEPVTTQSPSAGSTAASGNPSAQKCAGDLKALDGQMQKDGYWLHGSGYGYGYPMYGYGYGQRETMGDGSPAVIGHRRARPGYEVRTLIASANILAENGQQEACDVVLAAARDIYKSYAAELSNNGVPRVNGAEWRRQQITAALPVASAKTLYRTDQLIGADVVNSKGEDLGSVSDIVLSPQTGKFAYLVIGRGGVFGIGEKYVPVPWDHFKATTGTSFLVLDTTKSNLDAAPRVRENHSSAYADFGQKSQKVDEYWKAHVSK